jgi:hypothetical protein
LTTTTTPKHRKPTASSVNVVVVNDAGEIMVIRRTDNGNWALPGGVERMPTLPRSFEAVTIWLHYLTRVGTDKLPALGVATTEGEFELLT